MKKNTRRLALLSCLTASALLLAWLEFLLPLPIPLPGVKLGLANLAAVYALYRLSAGGAAGQPGAHSADRIPVRQPVFRAVCARGRAVRTGRDGAFEAGRAIQRVRREHGRRGGA